MNAWMIRAAAVAGGTLLSAVCSAQGVVENVVVQNRLYRVSSRFELSLSVGVTPVSRLTEHIPLAVSAAYNASEAFAVELRAGYAITRHTGVASQVARDFLRLDPGRRMRITDDLSALWEMRANGAIGIRWAPIYGKISLLSELPVHFQAYLWGGGGLGQFHRQSVVYCKQVLDRDAGACSDWLSENKVRPLASFAFGMRYFIGQHGSIKMELRNYLFPDSYLTSIDRIAAERGEATGTPASSPGLINLVTFELGYAFIF